MDVIIKNVPEGCENQVREMAIMAIERFLSDKDMKIPEETEIKFETDIDNIRIANSLNTKFNRVVKIEQIK